MTNVLKHKKGRAEIHPRESGKSLVKTYLTGSSTPHAKWKTSYGEDLIQTVFEVKGPAFLCDEIRRDEDPNYTSSLLKCTVEAYHKHCDLNNKRVLDFGCGSGASAMILSRMFDNVEIVGVERGPGLIRIARQRAEFYGYDNVSILRSPSDSELPPDLGSFDCVLLNAVYEHLLPDERKTLTPLLWNALKTGGVMLINETPCRRFPVETHTTGLPLINYLPDWAAHFAAGKFSKRVKPGESWKSLLRRGVRGATSKEILSVLNKAGCSPKLLEPSEQGVSGAGQIWRRAALQRSPGALRRMTVQGLEYLYSATGLDVTPYLCLAIKKEA